MNDEEAGDREPTDSPLLNEESDDDALSGSSGRGETADVGFGENVEISNWTQKHTRQATKP